MLFLAVQQISHSFRVRLVGRRAPEGVHQAAVGDNADMRLHPEVLLVAHLGMVHLVIKLAFGILRRAGRGDDGRRANMMRICASRLDQASMGAAL